MDAANSRAAFERMRRLEAEWRTEAVVTLDGSYLPQAPEAQADGRRPPRAARAGLWHDGTCEAAAMVDGQDDSSYLPEFAAQLDAARAAKVRVLVRRARSMFARTDVRHLVHRFAAVCRRARL